MTDVLDALRAGGREYQHPKLRFWLAERGRHAERRFRVEIVRTKRALSFGPARIYLHVLGEADEELQSPDEMMWDEDLDEAFIAHGFRAIDADNEAARFALALRRSFKPAERRYGEGYFNVVLLQWTNRSPFSSRLRPLVTEILQGGVGSDGAMGKEAFDDCREQIQAAAVRRADDLTERLGWDPPTAAQILGNALAAYLDERFHVSDRRALGFGSAPP